MAEPGYRGFLFRLAGRFGSTRHTEHPTTGLSNQNIDLIGKRIQLLGEIVPGLRRIGILANIASPNALLELRDVQGAAHHRNAGLDAVYVFVLPPSWEVLAERLRARGSESVSTQAQRLLVARQELAHYTAYDYVVINDQLDDAVGTLQAIIVAERHRIRRVGTVPIAPLLAPQQTKG